MATLSAIVLTYNEERNIATCLQSLTFADEVLIIDAGSEDKTIDIARAMGAKVYERPMNDEGFAGQRNFALTKATGDWVFYLDADERASTELAGEIRQHIEQKPLQAAAIHRFSVVMGKKVRHGAYRPDYPLRLFPRDAVHWQGIVHESPSTDLPTKHLHHPTEHFCLTSWEQYFTKFNRYSTLMAERMEKNGKRTSTPLAYLHASYAFFFAYILKLGFLDGALGLHLSLGHAFYTLTKYLKLQHRQEMRDAKLQEK